MARSQASTPDAYVAALPPKRRAAIARADLDRFLDRYRAARGSSRATRETSGG